MDLRYELADRLVLLALWVGRLAVRIAPPPARSNFVLELTTSRYDR